MSRGYRLHPRQTATQSQSELEQISGQISGLSPARPRRAASRCELRRATTGSGRGCESAAPVTCQGRVRDVSGACHVEDARQISASSLSRYALRLSLRLLAAGRARHQRRRGGVCHARAGAVEKVEPAGRRDSEMQPRWFQEGSRKGPGKRSRATSRLYLGYISAVSRPVCSGSGACTSEQLPSPTATATAPHVAARCSPSGAVGGEWWWWGQGRRGESGRGRVRAAEGERDRIARRVQPRGAGRGRSGRGSCKRRRRRRSHSAATVRT